jgi:hypothetical protein
MKKVEAIDVLLNSAEMIYMYGEDMGAFAAIGQTQFIVKLAERTHISNKQAQNLYVSLVKHGYLLRFEEDNIAQYLVSTTKKLDDALQSFYEQQEMIDTAKCINTPIVESPAGTRSISGM